MQKHSPPVVGIPLTDQPMGWHSRWNMSSLETGWVWEYVLTSGRILPLLDMLKTKKDRNTSVYKKAAAIVHEAYVKIWSFPLPGDTDDEYHKKKKTAVKNHRGPPTRVLPETPEQMNVRINDRRKVRRCSYRPHFWPY